MAVVDVLEELDASGGDRTREKWNEAIRRVEDGAVGAIVGWNLSRFSRSVKDALDALGRIEAPGGRLVSATEVVADGPFGKLNLNFLLSFAQFERDRAKAGFATATASAVERGIHVAGTIPFGYVRGEDRVLKPDPDAAPIVRGIFERRAKGWSWVRLALWAGEQGREMSDRGVVHLVGTPRTRAIFAETRTAMRFSTLATRIPRWDPDAWTVMRIRDLMSTPVITVTPETTLEQAAALMLEKKIGSLVVVDPASPTQPVGMVTETDFDLHGEGVPGVGFGWFKLPIVLGTAVWSEHGFEEVYERARHLPVERVMSSPCVTIDEGEEPVQAARQMVRHGIRHLPVLRDGHLVGIVSGLDFLALLAGEQAADVRDHGTRR